MYLVCLLDIMPVLLDVKERTSVCLLEASFTGLKACEKDRAAVMHIERDYSGEDSQGSLSWL